MFGLGQPTPQTASDALVAARALFKGGRGWTQGAFHRKRYFGLLHQYCAIGAVNKIDGPAEQVAYEYLRKAVMVITSANGKGSGTDHVPTYNDGYAKSYADVDKLFTLAIEMALKDEACTFSGGLPSGPLA